MLQNISSHVVCSNATDVECQWTACPAPDAVHTRAACCAQQDASHADPNKKHKQLQQFAHLSRCQQDLQT